VNVRPASDCSSTLSKLRVLSVLESSSNANNIANTESSSNFNSSSRRYSERDSATLSDYQLQRQGSSNSSLNVRNTSNKESISPTCPNQIHCDAPVPIDGEEVMIQEKRTRPNGDGYTTHLYRRGRMLGKGGFAKVYLCTALDTNRNYAVKVVPKANLVKTRARQKVRSKELGVV
jgi:hypothetical protein